VANNDVPVKNAANLIKLAKSKQGGLAFGSYGNGSSNHLIAELFNTMAGIEAHHIPYRGSAPMMTDLIGGRIQFAFDGIAVTLGYIRGNTIRLLGVSTSKRSPVLPDEPTISESAVPGFESSVWFGLFAPAGTPTAAIAWMNGEAKKTFDAPEIRERFAGQGAVLPLGAPEAFGAHVAAETERWGALIRRAGIKME
jgi:tripartite-type tricarboxylate transporter receptor subunit TctC